MKVTVYGDSILSQCQDHLAWELGVRGHEFDNCTYPGTAACDWFGTAGQHRGTDLAVVGFMGNMFTTCTQGRGSQQDVYAEDIEHFGAICAFMGVPVLWVTPPGIVDTYERDNWRRGPVIATANKYVTTGQRGLDAADVLRTSDGLYQSWLPCDAWDRAAGFCMFDAIAGIRSNDNVHLQPSGQHRYAVRIVGAI